MPKTRSFHDAFLDEIRDAYDAEKQVIKALPRLIRGATADDLRTGLKTHLEETRLQVERLERAFEILGEKARGKHCEGMAGIIEEGKSVLDENVDAATTDACIIAAAQRVEHYEIAAYGTLVAWAKAMGHEQVVALFERTLAEEKAADENLSTAAEGINAEAGSAAEDEDMDGEEGEGDQKETSVKTASRIGARTRAQPRAKRR